MDSAVPETSPLAAAVDLGGTKIMAAVVGPGHRVASRVKTATDVQGGPKAIVPQMADCVRKAAEKAGVGLSGIGAVGACVPGPADPVAGVVHRAVNLAWDDPIPLAGQLSRELNGIPVTLENDVNAGTYGEFVAGAARGVEDVIGIFVGTGIGGGIVLSGELRRGPRFIAGEVGHTILQVDGPLCSCGSRGCAEVLASRSSLERRIEQRLSQGENSVVTQLIAKKKRKRLTSGVIRRAWKRGDPLVIEEVREMARHLGLLTSSLVNVIDPQMVVFGGGVVEKMGESLLDLVRESAYGNLMSKPGFNIVAAALGDDAGPVGAAALAREMAGIDG